MNARALELGSVLRIDGRGEPRSYALPTRHLVTHGCILGMTGSGKTGLLVGVVEEALRSKVPVLMVDVKGDLPNLLLTLPPGDPDAYEPWLEGEQTTAGDPSPAKTAALQVARERTEQLAEWGIDAADVAAFRERTSVRVITPGSHAGESLHVLSPLETPSTLWTTDEDSARESLSATISLIMRLVGRDPDPTRSRDHVVLSHLAEARLRAGRPADLASLLRDLAESPPGEMGAMTLDEYLPERDRKNLATALNTLLASPTFAAWRKGVALDPGAWLTPGPDGKTPAVILSVAHLDDDERALILGLLFDQLLAWVRTLPGTRDLRALIVFDEVFGFLPPHPANPPAKRPLLALMKQARAFGIGVLLATQNPMDLDYRALSNAGMWWVGRLQTDADRTRVVEGLAGAAGIERDELAAQLKALPARWFVMRDVHASQETMLVNTRTTMSWMRGPMTRAELKRVRESDAHAGLVADRTSNTHEAIPSGFRPVDSVAIHQAAIGRRTGGT